MLKAVPILILIFVTCPTSFADQATCSQIFKLADEERIVLSPAVSLKVVGEGRLYFYNSIYFGTVTGEMRSFMERLLFPYLVYTTPPKSLFGRKIPTAFIYTMNLPENMMKEYGYPVHIGLNENALARIFGQAESLCSFETLQFEDYNKVVFNYFDPEARRERRRIVFPEDCRRAFDLGVKLAITASAETI